MTAAAATAIHPWWLASRSLGVVAMLLVTASVCIGLTLSSRFKTPGGPAWLKVTHEALALAGLAAILAHGLLLIGDSYLHPTLSQVLVPFTLPTHTFWTGIGVLSGWLAAIITGSFYVRKYIGNSAWRTLHKLTFAVFVMSVLHTVGAGTDGRSSWLLLPLLALTAVVVTMVGLRAGGAGRRPAAAKQRRARPPRPVPAPSPAAVRSRARVARRSASGTWPTSSASPRP